MVAEGPKTMDGRAGGRGSVAREVVASGTEDVPHFTVTAQYSIVAINHYCLEGGSRQVLELRARELGDLGGRSLT